MSRKQSKKTNNFYLIFFLSLLLIGSFFAFIQSQTNQNSDSLAATKNCTVSASQLTTKSQEKAVFDKVNQYRSKHGLSQLSWDATLKRAAAWQSLDMLAHNTINHTDSLGRSPAIRLVNCGYDSSSNFGENLTKKTTNPDDPFNYWKGSPEHNQLLLSPGFTSVGIAMAVDSSGKNAFWAMDLGIAQTIIPTATLEPDPTFACLGSNNCAPTSVPTKPLAIPTTKPTSGGTSSPTNAPTDSVSPTIALNSTPSPLGNIHSKKGGFINLIIQFILLLLQFLFGWIKF